MLRRSDNLVREFEVKANQNDGPFKNSSVEPEPEELRQNELLPLKLMPKHLQFNPFVYTGYRPQMNAWDCIVSLSYFHNETINILSHGLPFLYALWNLPNLFFWEEAPFPVLPYFHAASTICPWLGSSIYHLFMNHKSGVETYERLLQWDVTGVWVTQSCGGFTTVFVGVMCLPWSIRFPILGIYLAFALRALHAAVFADGPWERRISFAAMFIMRICIMCVRSTPYGGGHPEEVN